MMCMDVAFTNKKYPILKESMLSIGKLLTLLAGVACSWDLKKHISGVEFGELQAKCYHFKFVAHTFANLVSSGPCSKYVRTHTKLVRRFCSYK